MAVTLPLSGVTTEKPTEHREASFNILGQVQPPTNQNCLEGDMRSLKAAASTKLCPTDDS